MYEVYIRLFYEIHYRKHTIEELKQIKEILNRYQGEILEVKIKKTKETELVRSIKKWKNPILNYQVV